MAMSDSMRLTSMQGMMVLADGTMDGTEIDKRVKNCSKARVQQERRLIIANVKARYADGVLTLLEPLDLENGKEVVVSIQDAPLPKQGIAAIVEKVKERQKDISPEEWAAIPTGLAMNHKHYLYGDPKEEG